MGRLSGFSYQDVAKKLRKLGFSFERYAKGDHEIWINETTKTKSTLPRHKELAEGTLRGILRQARIDVETFLDA